MLPALSDFLSWVTTGLHHECIHNFSHLDRSWEADAAPDSEPNILDAYVDLNTLSNKAQLKEMKITLAFIESLPVHNASLDDPSTTIC
jgi:hypothetical protein